MGGETIFARALHRAATVLGGKDKLREHLRVSLRDLEAWIRGDERPPMDVFLKAVDIISAAPLPDNADAVRRSRELRQQSHEVKTRLVATHERSLAIYQAILERHAAQSTLPKPASALAFLQRKFEPSEGLAMVEAALDATITLTGAEMGNVQLAVPEGLRIVAQRGFGPAFLDFYAVVDDSSAASCGAAKKSLKRIMVADVASSPIFVGTPAEAIMAGAGVRSVQSTPLVGQSGVLYGMLNTHWAAPRGLTRADEEALDHIAQRAAYWLEGGAG